MQKCLCGFVALVALAAFSGCGDKNKNGAASAQESFGGSGSSFSGKYQFEVNGCNTGEHAFSSLAERCQMLANDELNHYCARQLRMSDYSRHCGGKTEDADMPGTGSDGWVDVPVSQSGPRSVQAQPPESSPRSLTVLGKLTPRLEVETSEASGSVSTTLNGSFEIAAQALPVDEIHLSYSPKVEFDNFPRDCVLSVRSFEPILRSERLVRFTLVGIDSRSSRSGGTGCGPALRRIARYGFQARFSGAYLVTRGALSSASVSLSVY